MDLTTLSLPNLALGSPLIVFEIFYLSILEENRERKDPNQFWLDILSKREEEFESRNLSKYQLKKMRKALEKTEHKQVLSSLILSANNPFNSDIPQMGVPENKRIIKTKLTMKKLLDSQNQK